MFDLGISLIPTDSATAGVVSDAFKVSIAGEETGRGATGLGPTPTPERPLVTAVRHTEILAGAGRPVLKGPAYLKSSHVNVADPAMHWKVSSVPTFAIFSEKS